jgi:hypothetical protein
MREHAQYKPTDASKYRSRKNVVVARRQGVHMGIYEEWTALDLGRNLRDGTTATINPIPHQLLRLPTGKLWLWLPQETDTNYLRRILRNAPFTETGPDDWERFGMRISNLWEWRVGGRLSPCAKMWESNIKWKWSLARHGLNPPFNPLDFNRKRDIPEPKLEDLVMWV